MYAIFQSFITKITKIIKPFSNYVIKDSTKSLSNIHLNFKKKTRTTLISLWKGNSSKVLIRNYLFGDLYNNILVFIDCLSNAHSYLNLASAFKFFFCHIIAYTIKLKVYQPTQLKQIYPLYNQHIMVVFITWLLDSMVLLN